MAGGRPPKLNKELQSIADEYLADCTHFEDVVPTVAGLAVALGVSRETVYAWAKDTKEDGKTLKHPQFSDTVSKILTKQERDLVANGLQSVFNPAITKLMLSANHNYREKSDTTTDDKPIAPLMVRILEKDEPTNNGNTERV